MNDVSNYEPFFFAFSFGKIIYFFKTYTFGDKLHVDFTTKCAGPLIASSEERNESLLSFRPSDDATKV